MDIQEILDSSGLKIRYEDILTIWSDPSRGWHSTNHLYDLIENIKLLRVSESERRILILTALFHDIVYDPLKSDNELKSSEFLKSLQKFDNSEIDMVSRIILSTKNHESFDKLSSLFNELDMDIVNRGFDELLEWERGVYHEYQVFGDELYKSGRIKFLNGLLDKYPNNYDNLSKLIEWVEKNY